MSGLNSTIYSALTASFVLAGLTYVGLPAQSLTAIFGTAAEKGLEDIFLWQLVGTAVSMAIAPIALTQQVWFCITCTHKHVKASVFAAPQQQALILWRSKGMQRKMCAFARLVLATVLHKIRPR